MSSAFDVSCYLQDYKLNELEFNDEAEQFNNVTGYQDDLDDLLGMVGDGFEDVMDVLNLDDLSAVALESINDEVKALELTSDELAWLKMPEEDIKNRILELAEEIERETEMAEIRSRPEVVKYEVPQNDCRKRRLCRHFLKGHCKRGSSCDFLHDTSIFCPESQKVFLGGLPAHITAEQLVMKLAEKGYQVINKPKVLRGFTPQVCLATVEQAKELIDAQQVFINGCPVDVRPYEDRKPPDDLKRSVFLGGLPSGAMVPHIKADLAAFGVRVCNHPILKAGFVPQVVLATPEEAQRLIKVKKVSIGGKMVEVRPYVNFRKRY